MLTSQLECSYWKANFEYSPKREKTNSVVGDTTLAHFVYRNLILKWVNGSNNNNNLPISSEFDINWHMTLIKITDQFGCKMKGNERGEYILKRNIFAS